MLTSRIWGFEVCETPTPVTFNPYHWATINWRAVCGKTACTVRREGSPAQPDFPTPINILQLPDELPASYAVRMKVTRLGGNEQFTVSLPVGSSRVCAAIDGYAGTVSGLELVAGKHMHAPDNPTTVRRSVLRNNREYQLEYRVEPGQITVQVDGKDLIRWRGSFRSLGVPKDVYRGTAPGRLLLIARGKYRVRDVDVHAIE